MSRDDHLLPSIIGRRMRAYREQLGWSQEKVGVSIGIDESSSRARISRYELGVHEPPVQIVKLIAEALDVPMAYLYCEDELTASLLLALYRFPPQVREQKIKSFIEALADSFHQ